MLIVIFALNFISSTFAVEFSPTHYDHTPSHDSFRKTLCNSMLQTVSQDFMTDDSGVIKREIDRLSEVVQQSTQIKSSLMVDAGGFQTLSNPKLKEIRAAAMLSLNKITGDKPKMWQLKHDDVLDLLLVIVQSLPELEKVRMQINVNRKQIVLGNLMIDAFLTGSFAAGAIAEGPAFGVAACSWCVGGLLHLMEFVDNSEVLVENRIRHEFLEAVVQNNQNNGIKNDLIFFTSKIFFSNSADVAPIGTVPNRTLLHLNLVVEPIPGGALQGRLFASQETFELPPPVLHRIR